MFTDRVNGTFLQPGTPYYMKLRHRDIYGNLTLSSTATSVIIRYTDQNPGARVFRTTVDGDTGTWFEAQKWTAYPFLSSATAGLAYYDVFGNHSLLNTAGGFGTLAFLTATPTSSAVWRMPCDGMCRIEARVGVVNDATSKANVPVAFGVMRIGSDLPGGNASTPIIPFYNTSAQANQPPSGGLYTGPTTMYVGTTVSSLFVNISANVSARSGDYLCVAVYPQDEGIRPAVAVGSTGSASYAHYTVIQD